MTVAPPPDATWMPSLLPLGTLMTLPGSNTAVSPDATETVELELEMIVAMVNP